MPRWKNRPCRHKRRHGNRCRRVLRGYLHRGGYTARFDNGHRGRHVLELPQPQNIRFARKRHEHRFSGFRDLSTDADGSGVALLLAYALDLDPGTNPSELVPQAAVNGDSLSLTYYAGRSDITYLPQTTDNLGGWDSEGISLSEIDANGFRTARFPLSGGMRFMRLMVTQIAAP